MPIDRQFVITQQGKDYVLYGGLLDEAHRQGLKDIETTLAQVPGPENGHVAIVTATVRLVSPDGIARHFQGIGDASPDNVNRMMAKALIRMAETRAKARALRDAINLGGDDPEELEPDLATPQQIDVPDQPHRPSPKAQTPAAPAPSAARSSSASAPAAATGPTPAAPAANAAVVAHPVNQPPGTIRSVAAARAETAQADDRLSLALGYRARPAPDNESQLRGHLTNLLRAAETNSIPLHLSHQPAALNPALLGPAILEVETRIKAALLDVDLGTIQPAVPPKAKVAAG